jgi:hypothetical protein
MDNTELVEALRGKNLLVRRVGDCDMEACMEVVDVVQARNRIVMVCSDDTIRFGSDWDEHEMRIVRPLQGRAGRRPQALPEVRRQLPASRT